MLIQCDNCGEEFTIKEKKFSHKIPSGNRLHKMANCPNCGGKTFYDVLRKYDKLTFEGDK